MTVLKGKWVLRLGGSCIQWRVHCRQLGMPSKTAGMKRPGVRLTSIVLPQQGRCRSQAHEKSSGRIHDYSRISLWSLCERILPRSFGAEWPLCRGSAAAWPKLCSPPATKDVERATEHASCLWLPRGTKNNGRVWQEEGSTESTIQFLCGSKWRWYYSHTHSSVLPVMVCGSSISYPLMLCASTSLLMTRRSIPGWFHTTLQRWQSFRTLIQTHIKSSWTETLQSTKTRSHSVVSGWIMLLSTSAASWLKVTRGLVGNKQNASPRERVFLQLQSLVGSLKKHTLWQAHQQLHTRNTMICHLHPYGKGRKRTLLDWRVWSDPP